MKEITMDTTVLSRYQTESAAANSQVHLLPPIAYALNVFCRLWAGDKDVACKTDYEGKKVRMYVTDSDKADAINYIINRHIELAEEPSDQFIDIEVYDCGGETPVLLSAPSSTVTHDGIFEYYKLAFGDNKELNAVFSMVYEEMFDRYWYFIEFTRHTLEVACDDMRCKYGFWCFTAIQLLEFACRSLQGPNYFYQFSLFARPGQK